MRDDRQPTRGDLQLYLTGEHDCSYIDGLRARTLFVDPLARIDAQARRMAAADRLPPQRPALLSPRLPRLPALHPGARAGEPSFQPNRSQRRNQARNDRELSTFASAPRRAWSLSTTPSTSATCCDRHGDGDMADEVSIETYARFLLAPLGRHHRLPGACAGRPPHRRRRDGLLQRRPVRGLHLLRSGRVRPRPRHLRRADPDPRGAPPRPRTTSTSATGSTRAAKMAYKETFRPVEAWDGRRMAAFRSGSADQFLLGIIIHSLRHAAST
jgi:arginyl-tRNA--protein-N-Asp/Glu arginylyltransferase